MSPLPFEIFLALRYLRPKRTYVSIITLISIIGVMLGVAVLIIVISVMSGFDKQLRESILGFNAHLKVTPSSGLLRDYRLWTQIIAKSPHVKGVAPIIQGPALVRVSSLDGSTRDMATWVRGIDALLETNVSVLPRRIVEGRFNLSGNSILLGTELAASLDVQLGDLVDIYSIRHLQTMEKSRQSGEEEFILPTDFEVRGIFDVGYFEYNATVVVTSLANAQEIYDLGDSAQFLQVMLNDPYQANQVRDELRALLGPAAQIRTWFEESSFILNALLVEKNVMFYILFFIMIVAAFGLASALITFVVQKTREIGLLKALGATPAQLTAIFLAQSIIVGVLGVLSGLGLGMLALAYRNEFLHFMNRMTGFELFPKEIYFFTELPAVISPSDIAIICGGSLVICMLAGVLPAWNAGRLKPVEALRHE